MKTLIKVILRRDRKARLEIFDHDDGFFSFTEARVTVENIPEYGSSTFWQTVTGSGLYDNAVEAERDAMSEIPWLRSGEVLGERNGS
jgi:hypothetical protein